MKPGMVALSSLGFGGSNGHIVLRSNPLRRKKMLEQPKQRLVLVSGRTQEAVDHCLDEVQKHQDDSEFLALLDEVHKINIDGHIYRG